MTTELKLRQLKGCATAIPLLDAPIVTKDRQMTPVFNTANAIKVRYNLIRTLRNMRPHVEMLDESQQTSMRQWMEQQLRVDPDSDSLKGSFALEYSKAISKLLDTKVAVEIFTVKLSDLNVETNHTNIAAVAELLDVVIIDDTNPSSEAPASA